MKQNLDYDNSLSQLHNLLSAVILAVFKSEETRLLSQLPSGGETTPHGATHNLIEVVEVSASMAVVEFQKLLRVFSELFRGFRCDVFVYPLQQPIKDMLIKAVVGFRDV